MGTFAELTTDEIEAALKPKEVRALTIIHVALAVCVLSFLAIILVFGMQAGETASGTCDSLGTIKMLSLVHGILLVATFVAGQLIYQARLGFRSLGQLEGPDVGADVWSRIRVTFLIRSALLESAALFGLVVCLLGINNGILAEQPIYWLNAASAGLFLLFLIGTLPTRDRLMALVESRVRARENY